MNDFSDLNAPRRRRTNPALPVGLVAAVVMVGVHLFLLLVLNHSNTGRVVTGDWVAFAIQAVLYFLVAQIAAERQYSNNQSVDGYNPLQGVRAAGIGAAITTSLLVWVFMVVRGIVWDATGKAVSIDPLSLIFIVPAEVLLAIGLGALGGSLVERKYRPGKD